VILKGFTIRCRPIGILETAIYIQSENNEIQDNIILGELNTEKGADHNEISNNYISWKTAISLESDENIIQNNIIEGYVNYGILLIESDNNIIQWNEFENQGISLTISNGNTIRYNNFLNIVNAYFINSYDTTWNGNYWLLWPHILPKPIHGRFAPFFDKFNLITPYIPLLNFDWHPAKEPYDISP